MTQNGRDNVSHTTSNLGVKWEKHIKFVHISNMVIVFISQTNSNMQFSGHANSQGLTPVMPVKTCCMNGYKPTDKGIT